MADLEVEKGKWNCLFDHNLLQRVAGREEAEGNFVVATGLSVDHNCRSQQAPELVFLGLRKSDLDRIQLKRLRAESAHSEQTDSLSDHTHLEDLPLVVVCLGMTDLQLHHIALGLLQLGFE